MLGTASAVQSACYQVPVCTYLESRYVAYRSEPLVLLGDQVRPIALQPSCNRRQVRAFPLRGLVYLARSKPRNCGGVVAHWGET